MSTNNTVIKLTKPYTKVNSINGFAFLLALTKEVETYEGACIEVVNDSSVALDIDFLPDGKLDTNALLIHCGSGDGEISNWHDQLEFSDAVQATSSKRPLIVESGVLNTENGEPCINFDNANHFLTANVPYPVSKSVVSIVALVTPSTTGTNDYIIGSNPSSTGIVLIDNSAEHVASVTYRSATSASSGSVAVTGTSMYSCVADKTDLDVYMDGVLDNSSSDDNSDFVSTTNIVIGATGAGGSFFGGSMQFVGISTNDLSTNMADIYTQLSTRYDSSLVNEDDFIYFSDTPVLLSNGYYANGRLVGDINFTETIKVFPWQGINQGGFGNVDIVNIDSVYNSVVSTNYSQIDIYQYDGTTLTEFGHGDIKNIGFIEKGRIRITIKSVIDKLNVELPTGRFTTADNADLENDKKQICLGRVNLATPRLLDVATNDYFISDNLDGVFLLYDNGIQLAGGGVGYTETSVGFTLTSNPVGRILATVDGLTHDGLSSHTSTYEERISEHVPRLLANIDIEFSQSDLDAIWTSSGITSAWSGTDESVLTAVNELLDGFMAYMYADSSGELRFGLLALPVSATGTLLERETIGEIKAFRDTAQGLSERLQNSRNYNPYSIDEIAFAATESDKINLIKEYKRTSVLTGLNPFYLDKNNVDMKSQSLGGIVNGDIILQDIIDLWSEIRYFYTVSTYNEYDLNQVVNVTHSLKGLENGKDLLVIEKSKSTKTSKFSYKFWG